ncbi:hypothetical protein OFO03_04555 [Campylobacter sp. JMF_02 ED1]|nr:MULTISPECIES: hypothetical protein [unclassified Campylobacter]MDA3049410.1 hypothetical protein [Campylobacter sp. JMF_15 NE4]MDA3051162.1 hypothetical protein [Campylobacter sp. JMF_02 ED1]
MTTENIEASEQRFSAAISDFFGITFLTTAHARFDTFLYEAIHTL